MNRCEHLKKGKPCQLHGEDLTLVIVQVCLLTNVGRYLPA